MAGDAMVNVKTYRADTATVPLIRQLLAEGPPYAPDRLRAVLAFLGRVRRTHVDPAVIAVAETAADVLRGVLGTTEWEEQLHADEVASMQLRDRLVKLLEACPKRPSELAELVDVSSPEVVRALRPLRAAGRVEVLDTAPPGVVPDARARWYRLVPEDAADAAPFATLEQLLREGRKSDAVDFLRARDWPQRERRDA